MNDFEEGETSWSLFTEEDLYGRFSADSICIKSHLVTHPWLFNQEDGDYKSRREVLESLSRRLNELLKEEE